MSGELGASRKRVPGRPQERSRGRLLSVVASSQADCARGGMWGRKRCATYSIETGLEAQEREKKRFFDLADRLVRSSEPEQQKQLKEDRARMTFGE